MAGYTRRWPENINLSVVQIAAALQRISNSSG
jgi:hypothetical protein